jgi:hypothetical protein
MLATSSGLSSEGLGGIIIIFGRFMRECDEFFPGSVRFANLEPTVSIWDEYGFFAMLFSALFALEECV